MWLPALSPEDLALARKRNMKGQLDLRAYKHFKDITLCITPLPKVKTYVHTES
jgi:hypothetical protein